jgi:hypothetical protein
MTDIDKMTSDEWLAHRRGVVDAHYASGKKLIPTTDCSFCDIHDEYVCFYCEIEQTREEA